MGLAILAPYQENNYGRQAKIYLFYNYCFTYSSSDYWVTTEFSYEEFIDYLSMIPALGK